MEIWRWLSFNLFYFWLGLDLKGFCEVFCFGCPRTTLCPPPRPAHVMDNSLIKNSAVLDPSYQLSCFICVSCFFFNLALIFCRVAVMLIIPTASCMLWLYDRWWASISSRGFVDLGSLFFPILTLQIKHKLTSCHFWYCYRFLGRRMMCPKAADG